MGNPYGRFATERADIDEILNKCNYSAEFTRAASDLQILTISSCYEEYRVNRRN